MAFHRLCLACCLGLVAFAEMDAQSGLKGRVLMDPTETTLEGAEVHIEAIRRSAQTDANGGFYLEDIPAGEHKITVRRIGFTPTQRKLKFLAGQTIDVDFRLTPTVAVIESLVVIGKPPVPISSRLAGFERRRAGGFGRFITWADLRINEYKHTHEILREAGVRTERDRFGRQVLASYRSSNCVGQVWLDGIQLSQSGGAYVDVNNFPVQTLAGMEYYRGPSETPPEFNTIGSSCGTLVIWTRER
jgi:hypothetical protein